MRILIVNDQHWPMKSGCANASRTLALGLAARGHTVLVVAPASGRRNATDRDENYDIIRIRSFKFRENLRVSVVLDREVRRVISDFNPDIVHVHTQLTLGLAVLRAATNMGIPVVATNHVMPDNLIENIKGASTLSRPISYIWTEYGNLLYRGAKRIIMPTESALELFNLDRIEAPAVAISNGIDLSHYQVTAAKASTFEKFNLPKDKNIITWLGRIDREKHLDVVVRAFAELSKERDDVHLLMVGVGNDFDNLQSLVAELGIESLVTFTGLVSEEDKYELHRVGAVFVMPSPNELQCLAMLEAMSCGKPVVAVDAGALSEICRNDENGYLVFPDDIKGFERALTMLLDNPARLKAFGKRSREIAETHDEKLVMPRFEKLYEEVIRESREQPAKSRGVFRSVLGGRHQG